MLKGKQPRFSVKAFKLFISEKDKLKLTHIIGRLGSSHSFIEIVTNHYSNEIFFYLKFSETQ